MDRQRLNEQAATHKNNAVILGSVSGFLALFSLIINIIEDNQDIYIPLCLVVVAALLSIIIAHYLNKGFAALLLMCLSLMCLGGYLLFAYQAGLQGKLFWFLLFPPMLMFCLGLRYGSILFFLFFAFLLAAFLGPFSKFLANDYPAAMSVRFLTAMFGAWIFCCLSEYSRYRAQYALRLAMERLEFDALTDALTGLGNRRAFHTFFRWVQAKALREDRTFCVTLIDIDHFKAVNDRYGHDVGDAVLHHTARVLGERLRAGGRLFRWGGEEFIALMAESSYEEACAAAERLRRSVMENPYKHAEIRIDYTVSLGLYCGRPEEEVRRQVAQADAMLYKAKTSGRNQVQSCRRDAGGEGALPIISLGVVSK